MWREENKFIAIKRLGLLLLLLLLLAEEEEEEEDLKVRNCLEN